MFSTLLGYIVAKVCVSLRNLTWFTIPFLLVRGGSGNETKKESGHTATIELLPWQKFAGTNEICALCRLIATPLSWSSNYVTCLADVSILLSNHTV